MRTRIRTIINKALHPLGLEIVRAGARDPHVRPYVPYRRTVRAARAAGKSVIQYLEASGGDAGVAEFVAAELARAGAFQEPPRRVLEIGTGAGKFAVHLRKLAAPERYESYEPDRQWAQWLERELGLVSLPSDGHSLRHTPAESVDLLTANGVFLYIPFLTACRYFDEIARVTRDGAWVAFDILSERCFGVQELDAWLGSNQQWPLIMPRNFLVELFAARGFTLTSEFFSRPGLWKTHYLVFRRRAR